MAKRETPTLACPHCGWDGSTPGAHWRCFRYLEQVTHHREVRGFDDRGTLIVGQEESIEIEDGGANHRLLCGNCLTEFPLPAAEVDLA